MTSADNAPLSFSCPQCHKRLQAPANLAGTQSRCPHCQSTLRVPLHSRTTEKVEGYALEGDLGATLTKPQGEIPVNCPVCHARMLADENQIGQKMVCPDCGTPTPVVRPPQEPPKKPARTAAEVGEYALANEVSHKPGEVPAADQDYVPLNCSLCSTRMLALPNQVGSRMICPDCGTATVVPPMPPKRKKIDVMADAGDGYTLSNYDVARPQASSPQPVLTRDEPPEPEPRLVPRRKRHTLPDHPFMQGTFSFPFLPGVRSRTILLGVFSLVFSALGCICAWLAMTGNAMAIFTCAMLGGAAAILVLMWFIILAATVLTVLQETASGCDEIQEWPGAVFLDWMGDSVWLFCAICMSGVPGAALAWALGLQNTPGQALLFFVSLFFMFPIVLMSMIETNSVMGIVSLPVLRTIVSATSGWFRFYVASAVLFIAILGIEWAACFLNPIFGFVVVSLTQAVLWLVYFRLIGRLAWYCTVRSAHDELEESIDAALDDDDEDEDAVGEDDLL
jgi:DNA-directed RNA polymerase subunit RPC12/RpoP